MSNSPSLTTWTPARKPQRVWLWGPFVLAALLFVTLSGVWFWMRGEVVKHIDAARTRTEARGWALNWSRRRVTGFPFRLDVDLEAPRVWEPSGWGLAAPILKAEAFVFAPSHWVIVAPEGLTVIRRRGGTLNVAGSALRASLSDVSSSPPRFSFEGLGLTFTPGPGAAPFMLRSASELHLHTKAGPHDQGAIYLELDGAGADLGGLIGRIARGRPSSLLADAIYTRASFLRGANWPSAARAWRIAGGELTVRHLALSAGVARLESRSGSLSVGGDGRLRGSVSLALEQAPRTLADLSDGGALFPEAARAETEVAGARQQGSFAYLPLTFEAGRTTLGSIAIGPAPRVY